MTTHWDVLSGAFRIPRKFPGKKGKVYLGRGVRIEKGAFLKGPAILDDGCVVQEGARILPYTVLGKKCIVGKKSSISKSVLWGGVRVGEGAEIIEAVLGQGCKIQNNRRVPENTVFGDKSIF
jgi:NDP-sugar pyrophosphorylase family protein